MKKRVVYIAAILLVIILIAGGIFAYTASKPKPEEVFRKYVEKTVSISSAAQSETYEGTNSSGTAKGFLDTAKKQLLFTGDFTCSGKTDSGDVKLSAAIQTENALNYIKLNEVSGQLTDLDGKVIDLEKAFSKAKNTWYKIDEEDPTLKAQLDSGIYLSNSGVAASGYDTQKIANALIDKKVFSYTSSTEENGNFVFNIVSDKNKYLEVVKEIFPNLSQPDLILDSIFDDGARKESVVTIGKDGTYLSEKLQYANPCVELIIIATGEEARDIPKSLSIKVTPKSQNEINITPVSSSKSIEDLLSKDVEF